MIACYDLIVPHPRSRDERLFDAVSFEVPTNSWVEFIGPSGAGKSTLFDLMTLRAKPKKGKVLLGGRQVARSSKRQLTHLRRRIGSCAQDPLFLPDRTVLENLLLPLVARGETRRAIEIVTDELQQWGVTKLADLSIRALTHSERRVIGVMRACLGSPSLVVLDEPTDGVEGLWRNRICQNLRRIQLAHGTTIVILGKESLAGRKGWGTEVRISQGHLDTTEHTLHPPSPETAGVFR